jgi:hypothetical protein
MLLRRRFHINHLNIKRFFDVICHYQIINHYKSGKPSYCITILVLIILSKANDIHIGISKAVAIATGVRKGRFFYSHFFIISSINRKLT